MILILTFVVMRVVTLLLFCLNIKGLFFPRCITILPFIVPLSSSRATLGRSTERCFCCPLIPTILVRGPTTVKTGASMRVLRTIILVYLSSFPFPSANNFGLLGLVFIRHIPLNIPFLGVVVSTLLRIKFDLLASVDAPTDSIWLDLF